MRIFLLLISNSVNSFKLYKKLSSITLNDSDVLMSFDVVSLFTNVLIDLVIIGLKSRWHYISNHAKISLNEFLIAVLFVLSSTYFTFDLSYKQTFGIPMGTSLSPIIADIVLQHIENKALDSINIKLPFFL